MPRNDAPLPADALVSTTEEQAIEYLVFHCPERPDFMPPPEAFLSPGTWALASVISDIYQQGARLDIFVVRERFRGRTLEYIADVHARRGGSPPAGAAACEKLIRRHQQQRLKDLASRVLRAERSGDYDLLLSLLTEKTALARSLYSRSQAIMRPVVVKDSLCSAGAALERPMEGEPEHATGREDGAPAHHQQRLAMAGRRGSGPGHVYLLLWPERKWYKIGHSIHAPTRLCQIRRHYSKNITLIAYGQFKDRIAEEARLHREFVERKVFGEWFDLSPDQAERLASRLRSSR